MVERQTPEREVGGSKATSALLYPPQTVFVGGYTVFTLSVRPFVRNVLFP